MKFGETGLVEFATVDSAFESDLILVEEKGLN